MVHSMSILTIMDVKSSKDERADWFVLYLAKGFGTP